MNLLPTARKKILTKLYFTRVAVVAAGMLSLTLFIHLTLMVPSFVETHLAVSAREREVAGLGERLAVTEDKQVSERVSVLTARVSQLAQSARTHTASSVFRGILAVPHPGVRITGLSFAPGSSAKMVLVGVAATRESLRSYTATLGTLPYVSNVDLPISAYAKEANIEFTITLTGSFIL